MMITPDDDYRVLALGVEPDNYRNNSDYSWFPPRPSFGTLLAFHLKRLDHASFVFGGLCSGQPSEILSCRVQGFWLRWT